MHSLVSLHQSPFFQWRSGIVQWRESNHQLVMMKLSETYGVWVGKDPRCPLTRDSATDSCDEVENTLRLGMWS